MASDALLEDVLRCRYPVSKSISPSGFGWDTPRLNEVIGTHTANVARPVDETDFYGIEDAIAQALRDCEGEDPDTCSLSPKTLRRLRMALTAARTAPAADSDLTEAWNKVRIEARSISGGRGIGDLLVAVEAYGRAVTSGAHPTPPNDAEALCEIARAGVLKGLRLQLDRMRGRYALACVISALRDSAVYTDEEGEDTEALAELLAWLDGIDGVPVPADQMKRTAGTDSPGEVPNETI